MGISSLLGKKASAYLILLFYLLALLPGCASKKANNPHSSEMKFNIDNSKLGAAINDTLYNLRFNPPLNWNNAGQKKVDEAGRAITKALAGNNQLSVKPLYIFVNGSDGSVLNIADIRLNPEQNNFDLKIKEYGRIMFGSDSTNVKKAFYTKDGIEIAQFLIQKNGFVNFRLLFENGIGNLLQFDYLSKQEDYSNEVKAIESSIGSIKLIKIH